MEKKLFLYGLTATVVCFLLLNTFLYPSYSEAATVKKVVRSVWLTYDNPTIGINMKYPPSWEIESKVNAKDGYSVSFNSPDAGTKLDITAIIPEGSPKGSVSVSKWAAGFISNYEKSKPYYSVIDRTPTTLAGNPAYKVVYTEETKTKQKIWVKTKYMEIKAMQTFMVDGKNGYMFLYLSCCNSPETYAKYLPTVNRMLASVQMIN